MNMSAKGGYMRRVDVVVACAQHVVYDAFLAQGGQMGL